VEQKVVTHYKQRSAVTTILIFVIFVYLIIGISWSMVLVNTRIFKFLENGLEVSNIFG